MERTIVIIKPDGVEKRFVGKIITRIEALGLTVTDIRTRKVSIKECKKLYPKTRKNLPSIYIAVEKHMTERASILCIVEGQDAVKKVRRLRGPTNLLEAPEGTIRRDFITNEERELFRQGRSVQNVMHAPDDNEEAEFEISLFFESREG